MALKPASVSDLFLGLMVGALSIGGLGCKIPIFGPSSAPVKNESLTSKTEKDSAEYSSAKAREAKANGELLREIFLVVYMHEPKDRAEFGSLVDSLNQGASLEGIYNGFTHSAIYRQFEVANPGTLPGALRIFADELAAIESELETPTDFDASAAKPLAGSGMDGDGSGVSEIAFNQKSSGTPKTLADRYFKHFMGASIFTLKRVLGDEALRLVNEKRKYRDQLALWYSKWVGRIALRNVDFGIPQRNQVDEKFHQQWALNATEDRLKWEVLNRIHRILNEANKKKP